MKLLVIAMPGSVTFVAEMSGGAARGPLGKRGGILPQLDLGSEGGERQNDGGDLRAGQTVAAQVVELHGWLATLQFVLRNPAGPAIEDIVYQANGRAGALTRR